MINLHIHHASQTCFVHTICECFYRNITLGIFFKNLDDEMSFFIGYYINPSVILIMNAYIAEWWRTSDFAIFSHAIMLPFNIITQLQYVAFGKHHAHIPTQNICTIRFLIDDKIFPVKMELNLSFFS